MEPDAEIFPEGLSVRGLAVDYGGGPVVTNVSFDVACGEMVALVGSNGAGKSSILAAIAGTIPSTGKVGFNGQELRGGVDRRLRSGVALVPENRGLFPRMSVHDHLWLGAHRRPSKEDIDFVVDLFPQLGSRSRQSAGSLSGGEAQMLALAMVLLTKPKAFLVDELSFGLAPIIVKDLLACCRTFAHEKNFAVLVVEQYVETVLEYADYGLVLSHGEVVIRGSSTEVRGRLGDVEMAYLGGERHTL